MQLLSSWTTGASQGRRQSNFDLIRLSAASAVILSHSFPLAEGSDRNDPLVLLLGSGTHLGLCAVYAFFIISGFLVARSVSRTGSLWRLLLRRILRIYPALIVCMLICAFVVAPFYLQIPVVDYLLSAAPYKFVAKYLALMDPLYIKNVQFYEDTNWMGGIVNGSLWTLLQEMQFYIAIVAFAFLGLFNLRLSIVGMFAGVALFVAMSNGGLDGAGDRVINICYSLSAISSGVAMYFINARFGRSRSIAVLFAVGLVAAALAGQLSTLFPILAAYPLVHFGTSQTIKLPNVARFGDVTYGTYLYGWPIQQVVRSILGPGHSGWELFAIAWPLALLCGFASWHLLERHFVAARPRSLESAALPPAIAGAVPPLASSPPER